MSSIDSLTLSQNLMLTFFSIYPVQNSVSAPTIDSQVFQLFEGAMIVHVCFIYFIFLQAFLVIGAPTHNHSTDLVKRDVTLYVDCHVPGSTSFLTNAFRDAMAAVSLSN